jgi:LysM repeat protein
VTGSSPALTDVDMSPIAPTGFQRPPGISGMSLSLAVVLPLAAALLLALLPVLPTTADGGGQLEAQSLRGSPASLDRQNAQARAHDFTLLETPAQVRRFVELGYLVPIRPTEDMGIHNVSFPYARPEVQLFLDRLSRQYRAACGERLVVTSLTRPVSNQPANASSRSVHPTGMAVDLRVPQNGQCRSWLESTLMTLERERVIEAIRERRPPHYHLAVFPQPYAQYVARVTGQDATVAQASSAGDVQLDWVTHRVRRGENLTRIAERYGTTVTRVRSENGISGNRILVGQELRIPVYREAPAVTRTAAAQASESDGSEAEEARTEEIRTAVATSSQEAGQGGPDQGDQDEAGNEGSDAGTSSATHRVARGESLWTIAQRYGVSQDALRAANGISGSRILVGQELTVPAEGASARPSIHRVARGESLWTIARRYGVSQDALRRANGINGSRILVGQELTVPGEGASARPATHRVARGESLWAIARRHGTTVDQLRQKNGIGGNGQIQPGQVLRLPQGD